jgi:peptidoglycan/LPS O-acetylase OafA/YrhL
MSDTIRYRREVDGLRALAVLPVILFHAGFETFSGGFVGVDVFFVISGYLITAVILTEIEKGKFSIINFYERRARRILPALFLVMIVSIPFSWLLLTPSEFVDFSKSLVATSVFGSNIYFWRGSGYFATAAELKPLLHTWSLALEEQFYLLFPFVLVFFWKLGKRFLFAGLFFLLVCSLVASQWFTRSNPMASFYLLPTRGWELLIGAFAAIILTKTSRREPRVIVGEVGGWLGVAFVVSPVFLYDVSTPFPGLYALLPCLGAVLIIMFASQQNSVGVFLGNRAFVGIGLISYSAYLWHQPLFAFARHASSGESGSVLFAALFILAFLLGYLSWRFVEAPFRQNSRFKRVHIFGLALTCGTFLCGVGFFGQIMDGFSTKPRGIQMAESKLTDQNFIVLGDSHGAHLVPGLESVTTGIVENFTSGGCIPLRNVDRYDSRFAPGECVTKMNSWIDQIINGNPQAVIVLSSMGPVYLDGTTFKGKDPARVTGLGVVLVTDTTISDRYQIFEIGLRQTLSELSTLSNSTVIFALDVPELGIDDGCSRASKEIRVGKFVIRDLIAFVDQTDCYVLRKEYDLRVASYKELVTDVLADFPDVKLFDPTSFFCDVKVCGGYNSTFGFLYQDVDHLSVAGSRFYAVNLVNKHIQN